MMNMQYLYKFGAVILLSVALIMGGCQDKKKTSKKKKLVTVTAVKKSTVTKLYYKGTLQALKNIPVLSPVDGTVTELHFKYGDVIRDGQRLVIINSSKLASDYRQAVSKYLQAKDSFETTGRSFQGTEALHKAGVISTDEYLSGKSQYETNTLNFYQARFDLEKVLKKAGISSEQIEKLSITDTKAVAKILQKRFSHIVVTASGSGVALFPTKDESSGDGGRDDGKSGGKLALGAEVKEGQLILSIGDLSGFSATLQVSEININKMKEGLKAVITGYAFPGITLHGTVTSVAKQGNPQDSGGALSMFNIVVQIPNVTVAQRKVIHVGMTANFEIDIVNPPHILLPINAVLNTEGKSYVTIIDPKTGRQKEVRVVTGNTTISDVEIIQGVKPGDKIVIHEGES
ncbi:efflux RND transporter periplasmic adaptor subunit [Candidiatus Paracoxiella cheracis]|uniref:efflux RND transporter periplasmic adaptor subunit n=1 Tax=Candidiatus Paracoxiella cheracis TaxID=3405120 RepID=UPI003BF5EFA9